MKAILVPFLFFLAPATSLAWVPHTQFMITPHYAQVQVTNTTPFYSYCEGYTYGMTQTGNTVQSWFSAYIPAHGYAYSYVYANGPFILVNAWANIACIH